MINFKKVGSLVKVESDSKPDKYVGSNTIIDFELPLDGAGKIFLQIGGNSYKLNAITDIQVDGISITDQADFETKIATVFLSAGGSASTTLQQALDNGSVLNKDNDIDATTHSLILRSGSNAIIGLATAGITFSGDNGTDNNQLRLDGVVATISKNGGDPQNIVTADYLKYTCQIFQAGTSVPYDNILGDNTITGLITYTRNSAGNYNGLLAGAFSDLKTRFVYSGYTVNDNNISVIRLDNDNIQIIQSDPNGDPVDGITVFYLEIQAYFNNQLND